MRHTVIYKSNNTIPIVEDQQQSLFLATQTLAPQKEIIACNTICENDIVHTTKSKTQQTTIHSVENKFELALLKSKIPYSKPQQLIKVIEDSPNFVIPKYRVIIFLCDDLSQTKEEISNSWKIFRFGNNNIEKNINTCIEYIRKWKEKKNQPPANKFTFVDLFAGIGGFRIPLEELGGKCLGFSEIDKSAIETYKNNFLDFNNSDEIELGSVTDLGKLPFDEIDLIVGGVPCQAWSVAGKMRGFDDPRGKLWNDTLRIVKLNQPKTFIFENVKGLFDPRNRTSLEFIIASFEKVGYSVTYKLLNSYDFGLPQNRERIYIIGIRNDYKDKNIFEYPSSKQKKISLYEIIEGLQKTDLAYKKAKMNPKELFGDKIPMSRNRFQKTNELNDFFIFCDTRNGHTTIHSWDIIETSEREKEICMTILKNRRKQKYGNSDGNPLSFIDLKLLLPTLVKNELTLLIEKNILKLIKGKGFVFVNSKNSSGINGLYRIYLPNSTIFPTLTATGTKDVIALKSVQGKTPEEFKNNFLKEIIATKKYRPITTREAGKLQGFPDWFAFNKNERLAKKQFGNAVSAPVIYSLAEALTSLDIYK